MPAKDRTPVRTGEDYDEFLGLLSEQTLLGQGFNQAIMGCVGKVC